MTTTTSTECDSIPACKAARDNYGAAKIKAQTLSNRAVDACKLLKNAALVLAGAIAGLAAAIASLAKLTTIAAFFLSALAIAALKILIIVLAIAALALAAAFYVLSAYAIASFIACRFGNSALRSAHDQMVRDCPKECVLPFDPVPCWC